jgi:cytochrome P450
MEESMSMVRTGVPQANDRSLESFDPFELQDVVGGNIRDIYPLLAELRRQGSVHNGPLPSPDDPPLPHSNVTEDYTVYGFDEAVSVLRDPVRFSSKIYGDIIGPAMGPTMLAMDDPEHRVYRNLVSPAFRQRVLARWETELVERVVDDLIASFQSTGRTDLVRSFTFAFPVQVIARILGLPREDYPKFQRWSIELISLPANWDRGIEASKALREYFGAILEKRRRAPADDLLSDLVSTEVDGEKLTDEEIFGFLLLLLPAGVETTYRSSGNLLYGLLNHPEAMESLRRDPGLMPQAIEEGLRWESPIILIMRQATTDVTLGGVDIQAGATVGVCIGSANRDERKHPDPDRFDLFRDAKQHMTFGFGPHMCLGMHLARMESRVALNTLIARLPDLRLDPDAEAPWIQGLAFRSPPSLPVVFTPV